jgi:hypothetical protein
MATLTSTRVSADAPGEMTPRERYIMRAVLRAIEEWEQLENAESIVTQGRKVPRAAAPRTRKRPASPAAKQEPVGRSKGNHSVPA